MKYQKKPIVVDAFIYGIDEKPKWFLDKLLATNTVIGQPAITIEEYEAENALSENPVYCEIYIEKLESWMIAEYGDYIVKMEDESLFPYNDTMFNKIYEPLKVLDNTKNSNY